MDPRLKQRLVGAAVLVALAVIFLPMLVQGPAPDSGAANVPLAIPPAPRGDFQTRELPLVTPGGAPADGALGMDAPAETAPAAVTPPPDAAPPAAPDTAAPAAPDAAAAVPAQPVAPTASTAPRSATNATPLFAATAGGDYAVSFGAYASTAAAERVLASLRSAELPAYRESTTSGGKPAWRVRIGPFATRAEAESARLRAAHVRDDVGARVVVLDAGATPARPAPAATPSAKAAATTPSKPAPSPAASGVGFAVQLAAYSKASDATALRDRLRAAGFSAFTETVDTDRGALTRVRVGPVADRAAAEQLRAQVKAKLGLDGMVRPHP